MAFPHPLTNETNLIYRICLQNFASQGNSYKDLTQMAYPHLTEEPKINKPHTSCDQILVSLSKILTEYYEHKF